MMIAKETVVRALDYVGDNDIRVYLGQPNINITLPYEQARDPIAFKWKIATTFRGRHTVHGKAFEGYTRKLCQRRWDELWRNCPAIGFDGEFDAYSDDWSEYLGKVNIEEVLKHV